MKTQHTPGPWYVIQDPFKNTVFVNIPAHNNMVAVSGLNRDDNAALVAAAPDMFEALQKIDLGCNHLATGQVPWEHAPILIQQFIDIARTAIAKAKGGK